MKYINYSNLSTFDNEKNLLEYVLKIDHNQLEKLQTLPNAVVCVTLPTQKYPVSDKVHFVDHNNEELGMAKLVQFITAPKEALWNQIQDYTYLTKIEFDHLYENEPEATISVIYDFCLMESKQKLPLDESQFKNNISLVIYEK